MLEGWIARRVDGRDHEQLEAALAPDPDGTRPRVVVAEVEPR
jgi:transketolase N-terminal domain/subunit